MIEDAQYAGGGDEAADRSRGASLPHTMIAGALPATGSVVPAQRLIVGAMSGTSADGVDVALVSIGGRGLGMTCRLLRHHHVPYDDWLKSAIVKARETGTVELRALARIARDVSLCYAKAINESLEQAGVKPSDIALAAVHGQTLFHEPPCTVQWIDPSLIASQCECAVISDFRRADCAAGGQGAPLVPLADYILFRHPSRTRVLLNIGGIANLTHLPAGGAVHQMSAFDTGPGNCVSDYLMRLYDPDGPGFDRGGAMAAHGQPIYQLMHLLLEEPYFAALPPKSTDGPAMVELFAKAYAAIGRKFPFENLLKTACLLTATTIADAIRKLDPFPDELIVSGGGVRNEAITSLLQQPLGDLPILRTDELGVPADAKEAMAFALLGAATLDGEPGNVPAATGATRPVILGSVTPRPIGAR